MYREDTYKGKPNTKKFVQYYLDYDNARRDFHAALYPYMLIEDFHLGIMPIRTRGMSGDFSVKVVPKSQKVEELIKAGLLTYHGRAWDITEAICDFVDEAAHLLATYGKAYYEIIYIYADAQKQKIIGFIIDGIPNHCIKEAPGICWQYIPRKIIDRYKEEDRVTRFVWTPKKDLILLKIPNKLGGPWRYKKLLSDLRWLSEVTVPNFAMKDMAEQKQTKGYDFSTYRYNQQLFLARRTKRLGWNARGMFNEEILEYYHILRILEFKKSKAVLRQYILGELNKTLKKIGKKAGFEAQIEVQGAPSPEDIDNRIMQLNEGTLQFKDAVEFIYDWRK